MAVEHSDRDGCEDDAECLLAHQPALVGPETAPRAGSRLERDSRCASGARQVLQRSSQAFVQRLTLQRQAIRRFARHSWQICLAVSRPSQGLYFQLYANGFECHVLSLVISAFVF